MISKFHKCNAHIESYVYGCEEFYSYQTHVATTYFYHRFDRNNSVYQSFCLLFLRCNATTISRTTTRQITRYLTELIGTRVNVYELRDMQRTGFGSFVDYTHKTAGLHALSWLNRCILRKDANHNPIILVYGGSFDDIQRARDYIEFTEEWRR